MNKHEKFLEFNGKDIAIINVNGVYWIALKSISEALNVDANRSYQNAKNDSILGPELAIQQIQVSKNGKSQLRNMTCIPEEFIYGWIFSLRSDNDELTEYKRTCYKLMYRFFHGTITNRKELLIARKDVDTEIHNIKEGLKEENERYLSLQKLEAKKKALNKQLNSIDKELIKEPELF